EPSVRAPTLATVESEALIEPEPDVREADQLGLPSEDPRLHSPPIDKAPVDVWQRIRDGFELSHEVDRKRVLSEMKWFVNHPEYVERVTRRAEPHLHYIVEQIEKRGLPMELALLPIVESAYDSFAYSHGRASGLWQFIPPTARGYGLRIDWWYDGRRDVRASTNAALDYLTYLNGLFDGDWLLALAAYNAGQGNVLSFIRASNLPRDEVDFWSLTVLKETAAYVPRLLAISEIIANSDHYHLDLPPTENTPHWEVVELGGQLDLHKAATLAELTANELYNLNAGFNQWATHPDGPHELLIPVEKAAAFRKALGALTPQERLSWQRHKVASGETLGSIAQKYKTSISTIQSVNEIRGNLIIAGDYLMIPTPNALVNYEMTERDRLAQKQAGYSKKYQSKVNYTVQPGDSFWEIARSHQVGMRELAKWNGMGTATTLRPGQQLVIYKNGQTGVIKPVTLYAKPDKIRKLSYRVRQGQSLALIANKFNVSIEKIKSWNRTLANNKYIHPGDRLTLYVDVTRLIN
ncbi:MAG: membrane-bound lytic murein transglycosylase D, partial [Candidatus Azotimanducaceae bacterium]